MANMIKFYRGLVNSLPTTGVEGALYITTDEGAIYYGTGTGMKRLGDFIQVDAVANLPVDGANTSALYYCVAENILAKWNGTEWKQVNKQPTAEEMKTLLGLGSMAYKSEVAEGDLNAELKAKVNAAAEGNHSHDNKALLDTYTQTEADLADAVAKKHAHTFVESELNKIADGDVAKWNAAEGNAKAYADEKIEALDYTDTAVDGEYVSAVNEVDGKISVTRKALPDYSGTYDAKGAAATALDNAKAYADGLAANYDAKGAAAGVKTELEAEIAKKVTAVEGKSLVDDAEITKLAGVSTGANKVEASETNGNIKIDGVETVVYTHPEKHAVADVTGLQEALDDRYTKEEADGKFALKGADAYDDTALAGRVTEAEGKITALEGASATHALKTEVEAVDAKFANYKTAEAQKAIDDAQDARIKAIEDDYLVEADIANFETKENVKKVADDLAAYVESNDAAVADRYTKAEADGKFALITDAYDDEEVRGLISDNADAIAAEKERAEGVEGGLETRLAAVEGDYLKAADKEALQAQINTIMNNPDAEGAINSINEFTKYVEDHGTIAEGFRTDIDKNKEDIAANAKAIADQATADAAKYETKEDATAKLGEAKTYADGLNTAMDTRVKVLEAIDHDAYVAAGSALKTELEGKIADGDAATLESAKTDAANKAAVVLAEAQAYADRAEADAVAAAKTETENQVKALADGQVTTNKNDIASIMEMLTWGSFGEDANLPE